MQCAKSLFDQLATLQHPISEDDLVDNILEGLVSVYSPFVCNIDAQLQPLSFDDLYGLLLSEEL